ncbi:hypothetical protein I4641_19550 [Waterburya agarophytonicola K14]|uniref:DUF1269 domain-containing protein n=1 Tax=Waterburya agarophytonicola KI4 TaxID=2874699 RepID=A0A964BSU2_9CYAN|nr:hypothetical protein [Waterburya agarophytonicola]MCC0179164.1 hypothetical protein [Waterburya agarophytonicola KI4]
MNYLIAVLPDRIQAEEAYTALEKGGIPLNKIAIAGRGYKTADELGLFEPMKQAKKRATFMAYWLIPFGFFGGYVFNLITGLHNLDWAGEPGNHIVGGILGAIAGAMGSVFIGGGVGWAMTTGSDTVPYRDYLAANKYLVLVEDIAGIGDRAVEILRKQAPEILQSYNS